MSATSSLSSSGTASEIVHLSRALKAPRIKDAAGPLAERARQESWTFETYLARVLEEEVLARETSGGQLRVRATRLPAVKTLDDFDFTFQRSVKKQVVLHLAQLDLLLEAKNVLFFGPPAPARPTSASPWRSRPPAADTASRSPPRTSGSSGSTRRNAPAGSTPSWTNCAGSRC